MIPPKIALEELKAKIKLFTFPESVYLVGIRGYYKDSMGEAGVNDIGIYDDCIALVGPNLFLTYNANTDPSKHRAGIATLVPGIHYYRKGKHGLSKPGGGYPALRPDNTREELPVRRDGQEGLSKGVAINIHKGGYKSTSSEGCQTIFPDQWDAFIVAVYRAMDREGQRRIPYILIEN